MTGPLDHIAALVERRKRGESFRPPSTDTEAEAGPGPTHEVEIVAPLIGHQRILIDGSEFKGALDCSVEFGLDKPTIVTLSFYANVRSTKED
jgi:hypothetical protein